MMNIEGRRLAAGLGTAIAAAWLAGCSTPMPSSAPPPGKPPPRTTASFHVPPEKVPPTGKCAIWYPGVRADRQPPPMSCNKAHADGESYGGVVIWAESPDARSTGDVAFVRYGPHHLNGVPADRLPPPGRCRLWLVDTSDDKQPPPDDCNRVEEQQKVSGGRVLYMPGTDLR